MNIETMIAKCIIQAKEAYPLNDIDLPFKIVRPQRLGRGGGRGDGLRLKLQRYKRQQDLYPDRKIPMDELIDIIENANLSENDMNYLNKRIKRIAGKVQTNENF